MQVAEYIVDILIKHGVTDTFGIPGGVILRLLDAMRNREPELIPHLTYHEQSAGFAACGYAQSSGKPGVAYATRGPGITNMVTCIAEAYQESLPVLFLTAHGNRDNHGMRFENNQELDIVSMVSDITKFAASIETIEDVITTVNKICNIATTGRKGPVLLDVASVLWNQELPFEALSKAENGIMNNAEFKENKIYQKLFANIKRELNVAKRPIILIGDGIRHSTSKERMYRSAAFLKIPVLSSRGSEDLISGSPYYFGYIGSHGIRYSNFILSKADLIISIGNRLAFPIHSESFSAITKNAKFIRIDIDAKEFHREMPAAENYIIDAAELFQGLSIESMGVLHNRWEDWLQVCNKLKSELCKFDCTDPVIKLSRLIQKVNEDCVFVCDIGNNEFWFARAFELAGANATVLFSKAYGTLGSALGKAIGAYYAVHRPVICIMGDQGFQYSLQELQFIRQWNLPIKIVVVNNTISGMITDHEKQLLNNRLIHVNAETGYQSLDFQKVISSYEIRYTLDINEFIEWKELPIFYEIRVDSDIHLTPNLPKGNACQDLEPLIERKLYSYLNDM